MQVQHGSGRADYLNADRDVPQKIPDPGTIVVLFDTQVHEANVDAGDTILSLAQRLENFERLFTSPWQAIDRVD